MSNVSFAVEDQTDEDFFDKLVDDDFGGGGGGQEENRLQEGDESDEMKAFGYEDSAGFEVKEKVDDGGGDGDRDDRGVSFDVQTEEIVTGGLANSPGSASSVIEHSNAVTDSWNAADLVKSEIAEAGSAGVKEIQWNSLFTDSSAENEEFGSDLFGDTGTRSEGLFTAV